MLPTGEDEAFRRGGKRSAKPSQEKLHGLSVCRSGKRWAEPRRAVEEGEACRSGGKGFAESRPEQGNGPSVCSSGTRWVGPRRLKGEAGEEGAAGRSGGRFLASA